MQECNTELVGGVTRRAKYNLDWKQQHQLLRWVQGCNIESVGGFTQRAKQCFEQKPVAPTNLVVSIERHRNRHGTRQRANTWTCQKTFSTDYFGGTETSTELVGGNCTERKSGLSNHTVALTISVVSETQHQISRWPNEQHYGNSTQDKIQNISRFDPRFDLRFGGTSRSSTLRGNRSEKIKSQTPLNREE